MVKLQEFPEHDDGDIPEIVDQLPNCQPEFGEAVTVKEAPAFSEHPPEQLGVTEPRPASTPAIKVSVS
jgi:hypothetical protein